MQTPDPKTEWKIFLAIAAIAHFFAAFNQISTHHPDEWFQTVELANFISRGFISQTLEFHLHMRNLTWPAMLAAPLWVSSKLFSDRVYADFLAVKFTTAFFDLTALACWLYVFRKTLTAFWQRVGSVLLILPVFWVSEWVRPSQEHLSATALAWAMAAYFKSQENPAEKRWIFLTGTAAALCGVFRYPSGLLSAGFLIGLLVAYVQTKRFSIFALCIGASTGIALGGLTDALVWGRPYESLWMYLQYNVFTGLSSRNFGAQSAYEYWHYWKSQWSGVWSPVAFALIFGNLVTLLRNPKKFSPAVYTLLVYIAGHSVIAHKEPRFMAPILGIALWNGLVGWLEFMPRFQRIFTPTLQRVSRFAAITVCAVAAVLWLRALWGETWRAADNYLEVSRHARAQGTCAVITVRRPVSFLMETNVVTGFFPAPTHQPSWKHTRTIPLIWLSSPKNPSPVTPGISKRFDEMEADCVKNQKTVIIQPHQPESAWVEKGECTLLSSGVLKILPRSLWEMAIDKKIVSGVWYRCPPKILSQFSTQEVRHMIATERQHFEKLPPLGTTPEALMKLSDAPGNDSTFADW